jgi:WxcM-like, C-terminal
MRTDQLLEVARCRLWRFPAIVDRRGHLTVAEFAAMPFPVRRTFFISEVPPGQTRGGHAQRSCVELLLPIAGSVVVTIDDGVRTQDILLQDSHVGLVIAPNVWCVLSRFLRGSRRSGVRLASPRRSGQDPRFMRISWRLRRPIDAQQAR